jgi:hypothetical protein
MDRRNTRETRQHGQGCAIGQGCIAGSEAAGEKSWTKASRVVDQGWRHG